MQLKKLEIYGFKSFADKIVIEFPAGITAIVGPNGSGKSNVVDAIRWVLGEQSAKELRGEKVEDFIFNGSNVRHKLGYAQVSLTFDNSDGFLATDFNEVTISRKAYRSGESEYYLNKSRCRLKDIQELFLDTGLGRHSFAMISQGQVESLIEAKPQERRQLFDDACGINKYKAKKEETLRKLERTELDLTRARDITLELEARIGPLAVAKDNAEKYLKLNEEVTSSKEQLILSEYLSYWKAMNLKKAEKTESEDQVIKLNNILHNYEAEDAKNKAELQQLEEELSTRQNNLHTVEQELQGIAGDLRVIKERQANLSEKARIAKKTILERIDQKKEEEGKIHVTRSMETELVEELQLLKERLAAQQAELDAYLENQKANQRQIEKAKDDLFELGQAISEKKNQKTQVQKDLDLTYALLSKAKELTKEKQSQLEVLKEEKSRLEQKLSLVKNNNFKLQEAVNEQTQRLQDLQKDLQEKSISFEKAKEELREKTARYNALCATEAELVGYQAGVKAICKAEQPGVLGVVAKLISVPDHLTKAAEAVMGAQLQGVVTLTDVAAQKAITYLKEKRLGKATFYPLNLLEARPLPEADRFLLKSPGVLGLFSEFLSFNTKNEEQLSALAVLGEYLGSRTFVTDNIENARQLARKCHSRYRIVTEDGEVIWTGGTMTGGEDNRERVGLLKRQALTRSLQQEIQEENKLLALQRAELDKFTSKVNSEKIKLTDLQAEQKQGFMDLELLQKTYSPMLNDLTVLETELRSNVREEQRLEKDLALFNSQLGSFDSDIEKLLLEQEKLRVTLKALTQKEWTREPELRASYQTLKDQETVKKERLNTLKSQRDELVKAKDTLETNIKKAYFDLDSILLNQTKERLNALNKSKLRIALLFKNEINRQLIEKKMSSKGKLLENIEKKGQDIKELRPKIAEAELKLRSITAEFAKLEGQIESSIAKANELNISLLNIDENLELPKEERNRLVSVVRRLEKEISSLGLVNVGAIEEYNEVYKRYSFLMAQINDLSEAKADLLEVLGQLDKTSREKFSEAFSQIKGEFEKLFKDLFGGGSATLVLEDGDILEAGIDIKAQPPGKKLQSIALLSGGEKTLTAIALVFAVITVKQVPFYLFDEVDAPLDEANLLRLLGLIGEKAKRSQIILITHRRRSMEEANLLYGVTMEEKGVSKILALRLEDEDAAATFEE